MIYNIEVYVNVWFAHWDAPGKKIRTNFCQCSNIHLAFKTFPSLGIIFVRLSCVCLKGIEILYMIVSSSESKDIHMGDGQGDGVRHHPAKMHDSRKRQKGEGLFICNHCGLKFTRNGNLKRHIMSQHNKLVYQKRALAEKSSRIHIGHMSKSLQNSSLCLKGRAQKQLRFKCTLCGKAFVNPSFYQKHMRSHPERMQNRLKQQSKGFHFSYNQEHVRIEVRKGITYFKCVHCNKSYLYNSSLRRHILTIHFKIYPFSCPHCGKAFGFRHDLQRHVKTHVNHKKSRALHKKVEKLVSNNGVEESLVALNNPCDLKRVKTKTRNFSCKICGQTCVGPKALVIHMRKHIVERPYKCQKCGDSFKRSQHLARHVRVHSKEWSFKCTFCKDNFRSQYNLRRHILSKHTKRRAYACTSCGKTFIYPYLLRLHMKGHMRRRSFPCKVHDKQINVISTKNKSVTVSHSPHDKTGSSSQNNVLLYPNKQFEGQKQHKCTVDEKAFVGPNVSRVTLNKKRNLSFKVLGCTSYSQKDFLIHMKKHNRERPYECTLCGNCYKSLSAFKEHYVAIHSGARPFKCTKCEKRYKYSANLRQHYRVGHFGESRL